MPLLALSLTASPVHAIGHAGHAGGHTSHFGGHTGGHFGKSGSHSGKSGGGHFGKLFGGRNGNHTGKHGADKPNSSFKTSKNEHGSSKKPSSSKSTTKKSYSLKKNYSHKETDNIFQKNNLTKKYQDAYHHQSILTNPWIWLYFINNHRHQAYDRDGSTNVEYTKGYHDGWETGEQSTKKI